MAEGPERLEPMILEEAPGEAELPKLAGRFRPAMMLEFSPALLVELSPMMMRVILIYARADSDGYDATVLSSPVFVHKM